MCQAFVFREVGVMADWFLNRGWLCLNRRWLVFALTLGSVCWLSKTKQCVLSLTTVITVFVAHFRKLFLFLLYVKCLGILVVVFLYQSNKICRWLTAYSRSWSGDLGPLSEFCIHCFLNRWNYFTLFIFKV